MGSLLSPVSHDDAEDPVFVIPRHLQFTAHQMSRMIEAGQQPGVPFRVGGLGTQRPSRAQKRLSITDSIISLRRESLTLQSMKNGQFGICFSYDAAVASEAYVCIGARDEPSPNELRVSGCSAVWGPLKLDAGKNVTFDSLTIAGKPLMFDLKQLPSRSRAQSSSNMINSNNFDIIVLLGEGIKVHKSETGRRKTTEGGNSKRTVVLVSPDDNHIVPHKAAAVRSSRTLPSLPTDNVIQRQITYFRLKHNDLNNNSRLQCTAVLQKVLFKSNVYVVQELYGLDKDVSPPSPAGEIGVTETEDGEPVDIPDGDVTQVPQTTVASTLDGGSECCICLTDPREVAVYPCRHMCMCSSCAEALPSQANKCPICRRAAVMLIRLRGSPIVSDIDGNNAQDNSINEEISVENGSLAHLRSGKTTHAFEVDDAQRV